MNTAIFHFVGGDAFFTGLVTVAIGASLMATSGGRRHRIGSAAILIGWILVVVSATAHPVALYVIAAILSIVAMTARPTGSAPEATAAEDQVESDTQSKSQPMKQSLYWGLCVVAFSMILFELIAYHPANIQISSERPVIVIGDSLSAGINDGVDITWPQRLNEITSSDVSNHAKAGATCRSAHEQLEGLPKQCTVIVEIGGNDLLGGRTSSEFQADLETLLNAIETPDRSVVMFELPLPPFFNGYGYAQRELAARYKIPLIPRRLLASVLFGEDATLDSIHLSNDGHLQLAEQVAAILSLKIL